MDEKFETNRAKQIKKSMPAWFSILAGVQTLIVADLIVFDRQKAFGTLANAPLTWFVVLLALGLVAIASLVLGTLLLVSKNTKPRFLLKLAEGINKQRQWLPIILAVILAIYLVFINILVSKFSYFDLLINSLTPRISLWIFFLLLDLLVCFLVLRILAIDRKARRPILISISAILLLWLLMRITGIGFVPDTHFWNVAGVPVLLYQLVIVLLVASLVDTIIYQITNRFYLPKLLKSVGLVLLCVAIWATAILLWQAANFSQNFFANGPYPPNADFTPYSDASLMDIGGQYMLIGEGLEAPYFTDKPLYALFLGLLHLISGQGYLDTSSWQIAVFALLPVLLFILGKKFGGYLLGILVAMFAIFKETNAINATGTISVSNARLFLTEFPTAVMLIALAIALWAWFSQERAPKAWPLIAGGLLGLASMLRSNPLLLLPLILLLIPFVHRLKWHRIWRNALLFLLGVVLIMGPWVAYNQINYGTNPYTHKVQSVLYTRFKLGEPAKAPNRFQLTDDHLFKQDTAKTKLFENQTASLLAYPKLENPQESSGNAGIVLSHFLNNEVKALFSLPFLVYPQELEPIIALDYWKEPIVWQGSLPPETQIAFIFNLILVALGIAFAWKKHRWAGLVPLILNVGYFASNAFGRTSGSRYLLPADWTVYFYYLLGLASILIFIKHWVTRKSQAIVTETADVADVKAGKLPWKAVLISALVLLLIGLSIPIINISFPKRYPEVEQVSLYENFNTALQRTQTQLPEPMQAIIDEKNMTLLYGRMLYPRYRETEASGEKGLFVTLLTPQMEKVYLAMDEAPAKIVAGQDVYVLGCKQGNQTQAQALFLFNQEEPIFLVSDFSDSGVKCP